MAKFGKKYQEAAKLVDSSKSYGVNEAIELAKLYSEEKRKSAEASTFSNKV